MGKPTVTYVDAVSRPVAGTRIKVQAVDHPRYPAGTWVMTGRITRVSGEKFWTEKTAWIPGLRDPASDNPLRDAARKPVSRVGDDAVKR